MLVQDPFGRGLAGLPSMRDVDSWVVAILAMSDDPEECYALCGKCLRDLPEEIEA